MSKSATWYDPKLTNEQIERIRLRDRQMEAKLEAWIAKTKLPNAPVEARDLTDSELKELHEEYKRGLESMKNHPLSSADGDSSEAPYWKTRKAV
jgi:hypothetical protein